MSDVDDQLAAFKATRGYDWPNCTTPDCPNKACTWSDLPDACHPCGIRALGRARMDERYEETHPCE